MVPGVEKFNQNKGKWRDVKYDLPGLISVLNSQTSENL
jgi:hypothetical protein